MGPLGLKHMGTGGRALAGRTSLRGPGKCRDRTRNAREVMQCTVYKYASLWATPGGFGRLQPFPSPLLDALPALAAAASR